MGKEPIRETSVFREGMSLLSYEAREVVVSALELYLSDPYHESLRCHPLRRQDPRIRSLSAGADLRIIIRDSGDGSLLLLDVGDHKRVYTS